MSKSDIGDERKSRVDLALRVIRKAHTRTSVMDLERAKANNVVKRNVEYNPYVQFEEVRLKSIEAIMAEAKLNYNMMTEKAQVDANLHKLGKPRRIFANLVEAIQQEHVVFLEEEKERKKLEAIKRMEKKKLIEKRMTMIHEQRQMKAQKLPYDSHRIQLDDEISRANISLMSKRPMTTNNMTPLSSNSSLNDRPFTADFSGMSIKDRFTPPMSPNVGSTLSFNSGSSRNAFRQSVVDPKMSAVLQSKQQLEERAEAELLEKLAEKEERNQAKIQREIRVQLQKIFLVMLANSLRLRLVFSKFICLDN